MYLIWTNQNHFWTIYQNIEIIGTILKRSDETIDIELDQKYVMTREREKKLKIPEKERRKKIQIPVYLPSPASGDPYTAKRS